MYNPYHDAVVIYWSRNNDYFPPPSRFYNYTIAVRKTKYYVPYRSETPLHSSIYANVNIALHRRRKMFGEKV